MVRPQIHTPYDLSFRVERDHTVLCTRELTQKELQQFRKVACLLSVVVVADVGRCISTCGAARVHCSTRVSGQAFGSLQRTAPTLLNPAAQALEADYYFNMFYDDLPIWGFIGKVEKIQKPAGMEKRYHLFTHGGCFWAVPGVLFSSASQGVAPSHEHA